MNETTDFEIQKKISREIIKYLIKHPKTSRQKITNIKGQIGKKYNYNRVIKNATILDFATESEKQIITNLLKRRSTRTLSGVSIIAIMTKPLPCPGTCIYCPGITSQPGEKVFFFIFFTFHIKHLLFYNFGFIVRSLIFSLTFSFNILNSVFLGYFSGRSYGKYF